MKKSILLALLMAIVTVSCTADDYTSVRDEKPTWSEYNISDSDLEERMLKLGWSMYQMHCNIVDLHISEDIIDRLEDDNRNLSAIVDMVNYLSNQNVFCDTIGETDEWDEWCKLYVIYKQRNNNSLN